MKTDYSYVLKTIVPACRTAYAVQYAPGKDGFKLPDGFALKSLIRIPRNTPTPGSKTAKAMLRDGDVVGFVATETTTSTILVAFRGSQCVSDWVEDLDCLPVPSAVTQGHVHAGFQEAYMLLRHPMWDILEQLPEYRNIIVTGHSLGGAVALQAGVDIGTHRRPITVPMVYTVAGPAVAAVDLPGSNSIFASRFVRYVDVHRIVNKWDIVPHLPLPPLYLHMGDADAVDGGYTLDAKVAHNLDAYEAGVKLSLLPLAA